MKEDFGKLHLSADAVTYDYKGETYQLSSHPNEPCLYLQKGGKYVCVLHNAYNTYDLFEVFSKGKALSTNYGKDYDQAYDERDFCKVLSAALDSGREEMDFFYHFGKSTTPDQLDQTWVNCVNPSEPGILSSMKTPTSVNPFLMKVIGAVMDNSLEESVAKQILDWIESFLVRRVVCG